MKDALIAFAAAEFKKEKQIRFHRTHGRLTDDEREKVAFYYKHGISACAVAEKFFISPTTVIAYFYALRSKV